MPYAPPSFILFRGVEYLQIPLVTTLASSDSGSQYKLAALGFDRHVVHLIRPVLGYFEDDADFAGIDFATTIRLAGANPDGGGADSVEFIFPLSALRGYEQFNLTGQQLINAGVVLINGERVVSTFRWLSRSRGQVRRGCGSCGTSRFHRQWRHTCRSIYNDAISWQDLSFPGSPPLAP